MGQYYRFVNKIRNEESQIPLPFNFGLPWAKALESYDAEEVEAMFRFVVKNNAEWNEADELVAVGDYGTVIAYNDVKRKKQRFQWESYEPARVPPKKLADPDNIE